MSLRRHTMASDQKPAASHHTMLVAEFDKWLKVFNHKTNHSTDDMKNKFGGLVKAARDLANGKSAANTQICPAFKEKAGKFLAGASYYFGKPVNELPTTSKTLAEVFAQIAQQKAKGNHIRNRYFGKLFDIHNHPTIKMEDSIITRRLTF